MLNTSQYQFTQEKLLGFVNSPSHFNRHHASIFCATVVGQDDFSGVNNNSKFVRDLGFTEHMVSAYVTLTDSRSVHSSVKFGNKGVPSASKLGNCTQTP